MKNCPALLALLITSGCVTHVTLQPLPSREAPLEERARAFKELTPLIDPTPATPLFGGNVPTFVLLSNGQRVMDPTDLLPAVDPMSPTAVFAHATEEKTQRAHVATGLAIGMEAAGLTLALAAVGTADPTGLGGPRDITLGLAFTGAGLALAALIPMVIGLVSQFDAAIEQRSAFMMYPKDLRKRLALDDDPMLPALPPSASLLP